MNAKWWHQPFAKSSRALPRRKPQGESAPRGSYRPRLEALEDRYLLSGSFHGAGGFTGTGSPMSVAISSNGSVYFTQYMVGGKVGAIAPDGTVSQINAPAGASLSNLARGPDGTMWFSDDSGGKIWRLASDGTFSAFVVPGHPGVLAVDAQSNVWFATYVQGAQGGALHIARLSASGTVTQFHLPPNMPAVTAGGIAIDANGNAWFSTYDLASGAIGKINSAGQIQVFSFPNYGVVSSLAIGQGGAIWFSAGGSANGGVKMMTPDGTVTDFHVGSLISSLATDAQGDAWFASGTGIGRITLMGTVTNWNNPLGGTLEGIAVDAQGNSWIADVVKDQVWKFVPGDSPSSDSGTWETGSANPDPSSPFAKPIPIAYLPPLHEATAVLPIPYPAKPIPIAYLPPLPQPTGTGNEAVLPLPAVPIHGWPDYPTGMAIHVAPPLTLPSAPSSIQGTGELAPSSAPADITQNSGAQTQPASKDTVPTVLSPLVPPIQPLPLLQDEATGQDGVAGVGCDPSRRALNPVAEIGNSATAAPDADIMTLLALEEIDRRRQEVVALGGIPGPAVALPDGTTLADATAPLPEKN